MSDFLEKYGNVEVSCPVPEHQRLGSMPLKEFMETETGRAVFGETENAISVMVEAGIEEEKAVMMALGSSAVRDEDGNIKGMPVQESLIRQDTPLESKKK